MVGYNADQRPIAWHASEAAEYADELSDRSAHETEKSYVKDLTCQLEALEVRIQPIEAELKALKGELAEALRGLVTLIGDRNALISARTY